MSKAAEIKTRFSLDGIREAATGFRRVREGAADMARRVRDRLKNVMTPMLDGIRRVSRALAGVSFRALQAGATRAFRAVRLGAMGVVAAVVGIGAAAIASSKNLSTMLDQFSKDSRRLGVSAEELSVLNFAAEREGVNPEEVTKGIARIGSQFVDVRNKIKDADAEFARFRDRAGGEAAGTVRRGEDPSAIYAEYETLAMGSLAEVRRRMQTASGRQLEDLRVAEESIYKSMGPAGEILRRLDGLDTEKVMRGGTEGFGELADAISRVQDPAERLRHAVLLFGEDAGPRMLTLLEGGRKGIEGYRKELERLGAVVSDKDATIGADYADTVTNLQMSIQGVRLEIARGLLPLMGDTNKQLTNWIALNRQWIAGYFKTAFVNVRTFVLDIYRLLNGETELETPWLNSLVQKFAWLRGVAAQTWSEISKIFDGKDSDWRWLNQLRDGFLRVKAFAEDAFAILTGKDAIEFPWMNDLRDSVVDFAQRVKDAFAIFMGVLDQAKAGAQWILDLFGWDVTTALLVVGMLKFSGILGIVTVAARGLGSALGAVFGMASGATATAGAVSGVGAAIGGVSTKIMSVVRALGILGAAVGGGAAIGAGLGALAHRTLVAPVEDARQRLEARRIQARSDVRHRELMASDSTYAADWHAKNGTTTGLRTAADYDQIGRNLQAYGRQNIIQIPGLEAGGTLSGGMSPSAAKAMVDRIKAEDKDRYQKSFEARNPGHSDRTVRLEVAFGDVEAKLDGVRADQANGLIDAFRRQARSGY